jgi:hypothetical protein
MIQNSVKVSTSDSCSGRGGSIPSSGIKRGRAR